MCFVFRGFFIYFICYITYTHYFPIAFLTTFNLYVMVYEYDDDNDDDNDDNSDDSGNNNKNDINYNLYLSCLLTQFTCCHVLFLFSVYI